VLLATSLGGCIQASVFARPEIVYSTPTTVGVRYVAVGVQSRGNETEAMKLVAQHCNGERGRGANDHRRCLRTMTLLWPSRRVEALTRLRLSASALRVISGH
jgi:hypothetical protein